MFFAFSFLFKGLLQYPDKIPVLYNYPKIEEVLRIIFLDIKLESVQSQAKKSMADICIKLDSA